MSNSDYSPTPPPPPQNVYQPDHSGSLAIASFILGLTSILFSILLLGGIFALLGLIFGMVHLRKANNNRGLAIAGSFMSVFGMILTIGALVLYTILFRFASDYMDDLYQMFDISFEDWQGEQAPELTFTTLDGETYALSEFQGKRVIVDLWATWCPPCVREIPHYIQLFETHGPDELIIIGISDEDERTLRSFVEEKGVNYYITYIEDYDLPEPFSLVMSLPTAFFIDRNGTIQHIKTGYSDYDTIETMALDDDYVAPVIDLPLEEEPETVPVAS